MPIGNCGEWCVMWAQLVVALKDEVSRWLGGGRRSGKKGDGGQQGMRNGIQARREEWEGETPEIDDHDEGSEPWRVARLARQGFKVHALEGYIVGKTLRADTDIETRLPTL